MEPGLLTEFASGMHGLGDAPLRFSKGLNWTSWSWAAGRVLSARPCPCSSQRTPQYSPWLGWQTWKVSVARLVQSSKLNPT